MPAQLCRNGSSVNPAPASAVIGYPIRYFLGYASGISLDSSLPSGVEPSSHAPLQTAWRGRLTFRHQTQGQPGSLKHPYMRAHLAAIEAKTGQRSVSLSAVKKSSFDGRGIFARRSRLSGTIHIFDSSATQLPDEIIY
jgi:hypothetical protein